MISMKTFDTFCPHVRNSLIRSKLITIPEKMRLNPDYNERDFPCRDYVDEKGEHTNLTKYCIQFDLIDLLNNNILARGNYERLVEDILINYENSPYNVESPTFYEEEVYRESFNSWVNLINDYREIEWIRKIFQVPKVQNEIYINAIEALESLYSKLKYFVYGVTALPGVEYNLKRGNLDHEKLKFYDEPLSGIWVKMLREMCELTESTPQELYEFFYGKLSFPFDEISEYEGFFELLEKDNLDKYAPAERCEAINFFKSRQKSARK